MLFWDSVDDHMVGFRLSPAFTEWRAIVGPFFAEPPVMEHFNLLAKSVWSDIHAFTTSISSHSVV
jgi:hypothetical protein